MGSSLGPVLANISLTESENVIVKPLIETFVLTFYCRYVDDTLVMNKKDKTQHVLNLFNSFEKNLRFTVDTFDDSNIHFLDIKILNNGETDIYIKDNNIELYSYEHWNTKSAWIQFFNLAKKLKRIISQPSVLKNIYKTTKMSYYFNTKDRIPDYLKF